MSKGFIKLHREILDWHFYTNPNTFRLFIHLMLKANFKDKLWQGVEVKRGQIIVGRKILARELCLSEQNIKTAIKKLKLTNEITTKPTNKYTLVTLVNYDKYQLKEDVFNDLETTKQPTTNQQLTTTKERKERKEFITTTTIEIENVILNSKLINTLKKQTGLKTSTIELQVSKFANFLINHGHTKHKNITDLLKHFTNWFNKREIIESKFTPEEIDKNLNWFIENFNKVGNKEYKALPLVKNLFIKQLDAGYTGIQMIDAARNMFSSSDENKWHKKNNYTTATPKHLLTGDNLDKYLNVKWGTRTTRPVYRNKITV